MVGFIGTTPTGEYFDDFVRAVHACLPKDLSLSHVYESLLPMVGTTLMTKDMSELAWRLAANVKRLKYGPVHPWSGQTCPEWVPCQVISVDRCYSPRGKPGATVEMFILAGTPVGLSLPKFWTRNFVSLLSETLGFSKSYGDYPFRDVSQLYGMQLYGYVTPELCHAAPSFEVVNVSTVQYEHNRDILRRRSRPEEGKHAFACPHGLALESVPCHLCPIGEDACPAATHRRSYVMQRCEKCQADGWHDPTRPRRKMCIECWHKKLLKDLHT